MEVQWPPLRSWHSRDPTFHLVRAGVYPSYSPAGDRLVVNDQIAAILHNSIITMTTEGLERAVLFTDADKSALAPVWSPKGDQIAFALGSFFQMIPARPRAPADIVVMRADGTDVRTLTNGDGNYGFPSWSPDGRRLVYRSFSATAPALFIIDVQTRRTELLLTGPHNFPGWSPAGDRIAFTSNRDGDYEIYSIKPDGTDLQRLTNSKGNDAHLSWSPDGEWIAFSSGRGGFKDENALHVGNAQPYGDIWVMRADGTDVRQSTDDQYEEATPGGMPLRK